MSFYAVCKELLKEKNNPDETGMYMTKFKRDFGALVDLFDGDFERLKSQGRSKKLNDVEKAFIKNILNQIYEEKGIAYDLIELNKNKRKKNRVSPDFEMLHDFMQGIVSQMELKFEDDLIVNQFAVIDETFKYTLKSTLQRCHSILDCIVLNTNSDDPPYIKQVGMMKLLEQTLLNCLGNQVLIVRNAIEDELGNEKIIEEEKITQEDFDKILKRYFD